MDISNGRELAFVKDVAVWDQYFTRYVVQGYDLRITDLGFTRSFSGQVTTARSQSSLNPSLPVRLGGGKDISISFEEVKRIRMKRAKRLPDPDWYILTVAMKHWWKRSGVGKIILRDWQYFQVLKALESIPELKEKLRD